MANISTTAVAALANLLSAADGLTERIAQSAAIDVTQGAPTFSASDILARHVAAEIAEKTSGVRYPTVHVYCEKVVNDLREKFRRFSGSAQLAVEVRVSHEHMDPLQSLLQVYADAITDVLDRKRGHWAPGVFYTGGYTIQYGAIKRGGRNFLQAAKVELTVNGSME